MVHRTPCADVACVLEVARADVARGTTTRMRRGSEATWQGREWPKRGAGGTQDADAWQKAKRSARVHVGTRVGRHVAVRSADGGPTGIVGPGKIVGTVTRKRYAAPYFILDVVYHLFCVGLCPHVNLPCRTRANFGDA